MQKTISKIVKYAAKVADPEMIILFGSMANGTNNKFSDIDLLLIVDDEVTKDQISKIKLYAYELSLAADVLVRFKIEVEDAKKHPTSFLSSILINGKVVYSKSQNLVKELP